MVTLQLQQLDVPVGQRLLVRNLDWQQFERILEELGETRSSRIAYSHGTLEIRMPSPEHEVDKELIGDLVKIVLDEFEMDCECFGSTTFKQEAMESGIEPDQCFYIQNQEEMRGKRRIDLTVDPPPDLTIEVDVTSKTQLEAYAALGVPELWLYEKGRLNIYVLDEDQYRSTAVSPTFPNLPILEWVARVIEQSLAVGRSPALRAFRKQVRQMT
ncbi:Uma2 family endonuclease [Oscillatoria sp. CS-180]|uniref:Uma2 family endonuclease n=1 Tax=Oscillatoria sp. CS-180 TaxID=3021720 RepID=UPI00232F861D|nr:Uma2 family endonuclease [Oscillatoria sp. CS-180]MDB9526353.1 Uma2 family endonuclease [Oscillatoria sp. CS-180]